MDTLVVRDMASIGGKLPSLVSFNIPLNWDTLVFIAPFSFILAAVGLIESLMTLALIDELTETRGNSTRECLGQGIANVATGFFGGMGGCAMIDKASSTYAQEEEVAYLEYLPDFFLLAFILFASPLIEKIPLATLTGVMFMVVIGTFEWSSFRILRKIPQDRCLCNYSSVRHHRDHSQPRPCSHKWSYRVSLGFRLAISYAYPQKFRNERRRYKKCISFMALYFLVR